MLESSRVEELALALSLTFGILHMDLEHLTLSLLLHTVPDMILATHRLADLTDPRGYTLAKLCVMCVSATQTAKAGQKGEFPSCINIHITSMSYNETGMDFLQ